MKIIRMRVGDKASVKSVYKKLKDYVQSLIDKSGENIKMSTMLSRPGNPDLGASLHVHAPKSKYKDYELLASIVDPSYGTKSEGVFGPDELSKAMSYAKKRFDKFLKKIK